VSGRHRGRTAAQRRALTALAFTGVIFLAGIYLLVIRPDDSVRVAAETTGAAAARPMAPATGGRSTRTAGSSTAGSSTAGTRPSGSRTVRSAASASTDIADAAIAKLIAGHRPGSVSVAAYNTTNGASYTYGAHSGMWMASIAKLDILEAMLLQHQDKGAALSSAEDAHATTMIENSDNASADWLFGNSVGARTGMIKTNKDLGLRCTVMGPGYYWGLGTTCAADQVTLLKHLLDTHGPLDAASRTYAMGLLAHVEQDQRWGVGAAADPGTSFVNKNGWLGIDDDGGLWAVNSDGIITTDGQRVLISVLTQHNSAFQPGITLNESLAKITARAVAG
jgi:hypothetical protein